MDMSKLKGIAVGSLASALVLAGMVVLPGCGGKEEPAPKSKPISESSSVESKTAESSSAESKAVEVATETAKEIVVAKDALSLVPESADMALNLPPVNFVLNDVLPFAKGIVGEDIDLDAELDRIVTDLAKDLNVDGATSLNDIAVAKGLNFDEDIAVFVELSAALANMDGASEGSETEAKKMKLPAIVVVGGVTDVAKVEEFLNGLATGELGLSATDDIDADGITIKTYDDGHSYFIANNKVAVSNNVDFLKEVAARTSNPAQLRYGTADCPKTSENEAALLIFGANLKDDVKNVLPGLELDAGMDALIEYQMQMIEAAFGGEASGNDPIVTTLAWNESMIELKSRVDIDEHPGILKTSGPAGDLKLAQMLPEGTQALLSIRFTEELKKQIKEIYLPMIADLSGNSGIKGMGPQVIDQIGDELTIGITGAQDDFPQLYLMISLAQADATKNLLQMFVPQMDDQEHNGVMISTIAAPVSVPLSIAYPGNMVIISNGVEGMKSIIDHAQAGTSSEFFAKLNPALDPTVPRYSGIILNTDLITSILPLLALTGGVPPQAEDVIGPLTETLQEVRMLSEINGNWSETKVSLYLK